MPEQVTYARITAVDTLTLISIRTLKCPIENVGQSMQYTIDELNKQGSVNAGRQDWRTLAYTIEFGLFDVDPRIEMQRGKTIDEIIELHKQWNIDHPDARI